MICPLRFGKQLHEGGEECVEQCAWLSCVVVNGVRHYVCAIATTALHDSNNITADLAEWFDSEHVEDAISENLELSQDSEIDSREKLEADVSKYVHDAWAQGWEAGQHDDMDCCNFYVADMRALLDRQAAITKAEQREWWGGVVAELQTLVHELERDNADLICDLKEHKDYLDGWDMASAMWILRKYQDGELLRKCDAETISLLDNEELQARVNELEAELCAREKYPDGFMSVNEMRKELGELQAKVDELTADRDHWLRMYEQVCRALDDVARNYSVVDADGEAVDWGLA